MTLERRGQVVEPSKGASTAEQEERAKKGKPFVIDKRVVYHAWKQVKAAGGGPGVDGVTIEQFGSSLSDNLYKLWNRMSSGSYIPQAVKRVEIPKASGGLRPLGIPTVADRIAQAVVVLCISPEVEKRFHENSFGFRRNRSAHQAVATCRERCFRYDWVIDLDISKYFDSIDHELLMKAVEKHASERWYALYIRRWLTAPIHQPSGELTIPERGTPQGGVVSPFLANLFLHYVLDAWMAKHYPGVPFERYADDAVLHCLTLEEAERLLQTLHKRFEECGLELNPSKTRIVYCKDSRRGGDYPSKQFKFLGFDFKPRTARSRAGKRYTVFTPGVSRHNQKRLVRRMRMWRIPRRTVSSLDDIAALTAPVLRGWIQYFQRFRRSDMDRVLFLLNCKLTDWYRNKYRVGKRRAVHVLQRIANARPNLFPHWAIGFTP